LYVYRTKGFKLILRNSGFSYELFSSVPTANGLYESGYSAPQSEEDAELQDLPSRLIINRIDVEFVNPSAAVTVQGLDKASWYYNYYTQSEPVTEVPVFRKVCYSNVYPGIDLVFYFKKGANGKDLLKYDWVIRENGNAEDIALNYRGMQKMSIDDDGSLRLGEEIGFVTEGKPLIINESNKSKTEVNYLLNGTTLSFSKVKLKSTELPSSIRRLGGDCISVEL
jgi:hypothetical protein